MADFDAPFSSQDRPGFSIFDMIGEWTDHLDVNDFARSEAENHCFDAELIAELVFMHSTMFRDRCNTLGVQWDDLEGQMCLSNDMAELVAAGLEQRPSREEMDEMWSDCFGWISDNVPEIQDYLKDRS